MVRDIFETIMGIIVMFFIAVILTLKVLLIIAVFILGILLLLSPFILVGFIFWVVFT